jgi:hypothetical protein
VRKKKPVAGCGSAVARKIVSARMMENELENVPLKNVDSIP